MGSPISDLLMAALMVAASTDPEEDLMAATRKI
jgi:hypothetical protein